MTGIYYDSFQGLGLEPVERPSGPRLTPELSRHLDSVMNRALADVGNLSLSEDDAVAIIRARMTKAYDAAREVDGHPLTDGRA